MKTIGCVFIDNSTENLKTAEKLGIKTVLFNRDGVEYSGMTVNNFSELGEIMSAVEDERGKL